MRKSNVVYSYQNPWRSILKLFITFMVDILYFLYSQFKTFTLNWNTRDHRSNVDQKKDDILPGASSDFTHIGPVITAFYYLSKQSPKHQLCVLRLIPPEVYTRLPTLSPQLSTNIV